MCGQSRFNAETAEAAEKICQEFLGALCELCVQTSGFSGFFRRTVRIVRPSASCFRVFVAAFTQSNPRRPAWATAADRDETFNFVSVLATCRWTVCLLMKSRLLSPDC